MELRKDYVLERWVIIAPKRAARPMDVAGTAESSAKKKEGTCFFCPGNEQFTPGEIGRRGTKKQWYFRWFPNKFPAVDSTTAKGTHTLSSGLLTSISAYGFHEVIVETPSADKQLWDLNKPRFVELLGIYRERIRELEKVSGIRYVSIFKNHGEPAGASLKHSHTQIIATAALPPQVVEEAKACQKDCSYCTIIAKEKKGPRLCFENAHAIAFAPYASRFSYEVWIFPKRHLKAPGELSAQETRSIAELLNQVLRKLKKLNAPYNYFLHYAPAGTNLHMHLEVTPRLATLAGFELSSSIIINTTSPEDAAFFYRGKKARSTSKKN